MADVIQVLQVENDATEAALIGLLLARPGARQFVLETAGTLSAALERLQQGAFDVVLLDLSLPDSHGIATVQRLRAGAPNMPLVVLTGTDDEEIAMEAGRCGAQDYLVKGQIDSRLLERSLSYAIQRQRIEKTLADERRRQRLMMDNIPDCRIYFKDAEGRFLEVNPALAKLSRLRDPQEAIGKTDFDIFAPEHAANAQRDEQEVIRTGEPIIGKIEEEIQPDGSATWALTTKMALRDELGRIVGTFGVSRDITGLKDTEARLRDANARLSKVLGELVCSHDELKATQLQLIQAEKLRSLGQMAASVAHEVKNPLAILNLGIECLVEFFHGGEERMNSVVREMKEAVQRAERVIRDMLEYSSERDLAVVEVDVNLLITQTLRFVRHELAKAQVQTVLKLGESVPVCRMDAMKVEQVLVNLLVNACHAMGKKGVLTIRTYEQACEQRHLDDHAESEPFVLGQRLAVIEIQDSGPGIPQEKLESVFEPFFTTKESGAGTGLGLFVVKKIIDLHRGKIRLTNAPEGGLLVTLLLACG